MMDSVSTTGTLMETSIAVQTLVTNIERVITQDVAVGYMMYDAAPMVARSAVKGIKSVSKEIGNPFFNLWEWTMEAPA